MAVEETKRTTILLGRIGHSKLHPEEILFGSKATKITTFLWAMLRLFTNLVEPQPQLRSLPDSIQNIKQQH